MRVILAVATLLVLTSGVRAQQPILGQPGNLSIIGKPVSLANVNAPVGNTSESRFSIASLFRRMPILSGRPTTGSSNFPSPGSFPSSRYPNVFQPQQPRSSTVSLGR